MAFGPYVGAATFVLLRLWFPYPLALLSGLVAYAATESAIHVYPDIADGTSHISPALPGYFATMIAAFMRWYATCEQSASAWYIYTIAIIVQWYTYFLQFAFDGYIELRGHTAVTDYYAGYYKRQFIQQYTNVRDTIYNKNYCHQSRLTHNIWKSAVWAFIPILSLGVMYPYMSSLARRVTITLYVLVLAARLFFKDCREDTDSLFAAACCAIFLARSVSAYVDRLLWSQNPLATKYFGRYAAAYAIGRGRRFNLDRLELPFYAALFVPLIGFWLYLLHIWGKLPFWARRVLTVIWNCSFGLLIRLFGFLSEHLDPVVEFLSGFLAQLSVRIREKSWQLYLTVVKSCSAYWEEFTAPAPEEFDLSEPPRPPRNDQADVDGPAPIATPTQPADNTPGVQTTQVIQPTAEGSNSGIGIIYSVPESSSSSSSDDGKYDSRKNGGGKRPLVRVKVGTSKAQESPTAFYGETKPSDSSAVYDEEERQREAERQRKYSQQQLKDQETIAKSDQGIAYTNDFVTNQMEIFQREEENASAQNEVQTPAPTKGPSASPSSPPASPPSVTKPSPNQQPPAPGQEEPPGSTQQPPGPSRPDTSSIHPGPSAGNQQSTSAPLPLAQSSVTGPSDPPPAATTFNRSTPVTLDNDIWPLRPSTRDGIQGADSRKHWTDRILGGPSLLTTMRVERENPANSGGSSGSGDDDGDQGDDGKHGGQGGGKGDGKGDGQDNLPDDGKNDGEKGTKKEPQPDTKPDASKNSKADTTLATTDGTQSLAPMSENTKNDGQPIVQHKGEDEDMADVPIDAITVAKNGAEMGTKPAIPEATTDDIKPNTTGNVPEDVKGGAKDKLEGNTSDQSKGTSKDDEKPDDHNGKDDDGDDSDSNQSFVGVLENPLAGQRPSSGAASSQVQTNGGAASTHAQNSVPNVPTHGPGLPPASGQKPLPSFISTVPFMPRQGLGLLGNLPGQGQDSVPDFPAPNYGQPASVFTQDPVTTGSGNASGAEDVPMSDAGSDDSNGLTGAIDGILNGQPLGQGSTTQNGPAGTSQPYQAQQPLKEDEEMGDAYNSKDTNSGLMNDTNSPPQNFPVALGTSSGGDSMEGVTTTEGNIISVPQQNQYPATAQPSQQSRQNILLPGLRNSSFAGPASSQPQNHNRVGSTNQASSTQFPASQPSAAPSSSNRPIPLFRSFNLPTTPSLAPAPQTGFLSGNHYTTFGSSTAPSTPTATAPTSTTLTNTVQYGNGNTPNPALGSGLQALVAATTASNSSANEPSSISNGFKRPSAGILSLIKTKDSNTAAAALGNPAATNATPTAPASTASVGATQHGSVITPNPTLGLQRSTFAAPGSSSFTNPLQNGNFTTSGQSSALRPQTTTIDHVALGRETDKQLRDMIPDAPNTTSTMGQSGSLESGPSAPANLTERPRNTGNLPTTKPAARPANGKSKPDCSGPNLVGYESSDEERQPEEGSEQESDISSLNSEEKKPSHTVLWAAARDQENLTKFLASMTPEELEAHNKKEEEFKLKAMTPAERQEYCDEKEAEARLASQPAPKMTPSENSEPSDGIINYNAPQSAESMEVEMGDNLSDRMGGMNDESSRASSLSDERDPPSESEMEQDIKTHEERRKREEEAKWIEEQTRREEEEEKRKKERILKYRPVLVAKGRSGKNSTSAASTPTSATFADNQNQREEWDGEKPVEMTDEQKAAAMRRPIRPVRRTDQPLTPTTPGGSCPLPSPAPHLDHPRNFAPRKPSERPSETVNQPSKPDPGEVWVFEDQEEKGFEEFKVQGRGNNIYLDIPRYGRALFDRTRMDWHIPDLDAEHERFSIIRKSQLLLWVEGHDPNQAPGYQPPYVSEAWVFADPANGTELMIVYKEQDVDGVVQLFLDIPAEDERYFWGRREGAWVREGDRALLPSFSKIRRKHERDKMEMEEQEAKIRGEKPVQKENDQSTVPVDSEPRLGDIFVFENQEANSYEEFEVKGTDDDRDETDLYIEPFPTVRYIWDTTVMDWMQQDYGEPVPDEQKLIKKT